MTYVSTEVLCGPIVHNLRPDIEQSNMRVLAMDYVDTIVWYYGLRKHRIVSREVQIEDKVCRQIIS